MIVVMSLHREETARTSRELTANLHRTGLSAETVAETLGFTGDQLDRTLRVTAAADPADVWLLRDFLDRAVRDQGARPQPWTVLTDSARAAASRWFSLRTPPPTPTSDPDHGRT